MQIVVGEKQFSVTLEDNETVMTLTEKLPLTFDMSELNGNEKYYYLDTALPSAPEKIGHMEDTSELTDILGTGGVIVTFEMVGGSTTAIPLEMEMKGAE